MELNFDERRVLGALVEKGYTTPDQYPLTLNSLITACNQKSCRNPITHIQEVSVLDALDSLRSKGLASVVETAGGRTSRYRQRFRDCLEISAKEAAVLAELILRGPQTDGELRQNSRRMVPTDSLRELQDVVDQLRQREKPLIVRLGSEERRRGVRYAHTLYKSDELEKIMNLELEELSSSRGPEPASRPQIATSISVPSARESEETESLKKELGNVKEEISDLRIDLSKLKERLDNLEAELGQ